MSDRWKVRPDNSNWGEFGPHDQLGRLNLIDAKKVLEGIREVREGRTFSLSLPLDFPGGNALNERRFPPKLRPTQRSRGPSFNYRLSQDDPRLTDVLSDDVVELTLQYSTQWDGFSHVGSMFDADGDGIREAVYYNGYRAGEDIAGPGETGDSPHCSIAKALGIEHMAVHGVQGRGVMIDLHAHFGRERKLVDYDALQRIIEADRIEVERGDMVCFHTEFAEMILEMNKNPSVYALNSFCPVLDGRCEKLLNWVTDSGIATLIADNHAVEECPGRSCDGHGSYAYIPLHEHCLFKNGIHLGELWYLTPLARWLRANGRSRFLLTAPPLRLPGAVGSPVNPIATV